MRNKMLFCAVLASVMLSGCSANNKNEKPRSEPDEAQPAENEVSVPIVEETQDKSEEPESNSIQNELENLDIPNEQMVVVKDYIPDIEIDLKYATEDNFTGQVLYDFDKPELRFGTVKKLKAAQESLAEQGYSIKIWDAYRPLEAQWKLWNVCPDPVYVANPENGSSDHTQGNTLDITLIRSDGEEVEMPTGFDDFSAAADRDYSELSQIQRENVILLEASMYNAGFTGYYGEWWHYSDTDSYPMIE